MHTLPLHWGALSKNPRATLEIIEANPDLPWDMRYFSANPSLPLSVIEKDWSRWDHDLLSLHPSINASHLPYLRPTDLRALSTNPGIKVSDIYGLRGYFWSLYDFCSNPNVTQSFIDENQYSYLNWYALSASNAVTERYVESRLHYPWKWIELAGNTNISMDFLRRYAPSPSYWRFYARNPRCSTTDFPYEGHIAEWSSNPSLPLDYVSSHPDAGWNFVAISRHPMMSTSFVDAHRGASFDWYKICERPLILDL